MPEESKGFWTTLPGVLTGFAAVIGAVTGLYVAMKPQTGPAQVTESSSVPTSGPAVTPTTRPRFHLIVGSSPTRGDAVAQARKLRADGHPSEVILSTTGVYAVTLGSYPTQREATSVLKRAKQSDDAPADAYVLPPERWKATVFP
ncbi:MAG TPA: SPOR domain-containing protein [Thermoanaerobaculia bacterium]|nr:SPOR domain-containing protein [Thermoanaerobaculia bacterium]